MCPHLSTRVHAVSTRVHIRWHLSTLGSQRLAIPQESRCNKRSATKGACMVTHSPRKNYAKYHGQQQHPGGAGQPWFSGNSAFGFSLSEFLVYSVSFLNK